jgi:hypothetical protein
LSVAHVPPVITRQTSAPGAVAWLSHIAPLQQVEEHVCPKQLGSGTHECELWSQTRPAQQSVGNVHV